MAVHYTAYGNPDEPPYVASFDIDNWFQEEGDMAIHGYAEHWDSIDEEVACSHKCPDCGAQCRYAGYKHPETRSYRAFAVCDTCSKAQEF